MWMLPSPAMYLSDELTASASFELIFGLLSKLVCVERSSGVEHVAGTALLAEARCGICPRHPSRPRKPRTTSRPLLGAPLEPTEVGLFLGVHQVDRPHRQLGEALRPTNRAPQRPGVAHVHPSMPSHPRDHGSTATASSDRGTRTSTHHSYRPGCASRRQDGVLDDGSDSAFNNGGGTRDLHEPATGRNHVERTLGDRADARDEPDSLLGKATKKGKESRITAVVVALVVAHCGLLFRRARIAAFADRCRSLSVVAPLAMSSSLRFPVSGVSPQAAMSRSAFMIRCFMRTMRSRTSDHSSLSPFRFRSSVSTRSLRSANVLVVCKSSNILESPSLSARTRRMALRAVFPCPLYSLIFVKYLCYNGHS